MRVKSSIEGRPDHYLTEDEVKAIIQFQCMLADSFDCEVVDISDRLTKCLYSISQAKDARNSVDVRAHSVKAIEALYKPTAVAVTG